jgi:alpha-glucosidase
MLPALGAGEMTWSDGPAGTLCFTRSPGFTFIANLSDAPVPLTAHREILLASGPVSDGKLPSDTAAWLAT